VETYVSYLRKKLERPGPPLIHTIRLVGYTLREPEPTAGSN
jgi:two-component system OmpR family response regulator